MIEIKLDFDSMEKEVEEMLKDENGFFICWGHRSIKYTLSCIACLQRLLSKSDQDLIKKYWGSQ